MHAGGALEDRICGSRLGMPPWDTFVQLLCRNTAPQCVHGQLKGESGNCKKYVRRCDRLLGTTKMISNCPPSPTTAMGILLNASNKIHM